MYLLYLLKVVVLVSLGIGVSSSPVAQGTTSKCNARDIAIVKRTANEPAYFCTWWNLATRTRTPFMELTVSQVNNACKCISNPSKNKRATSIDHTLVSRGQSVESCSVEMSKQFTEPWHFCNFYTAYSPRTTSPFRKYSAESLLALCNCVEGKSIFSTTKSIKKTSVTKTIVKSSSTKSSSSKKPTSSSSKKVTSSSRKSTLSTSSSSKRLSSSSSHKTTLSSAKSSKTSSAMKSISTSTSSTSNLRKTTSSSKMVSSTKKTSSSTKARTSSSSLRSVLSASRSSISKSSTSTSIQSSSSTKSSSKILSSSHVPTTSSTKLSSRTSDSIKSSSASTSKSASGFSSSVLPTSSSTTVTPSTSTSSASAAKTPTRITDGRFYLRVANTEAPPSDYYVFEGEDYTLRSSRHTLFQIDSNGYLYQSGDSGNEWVGIYQGGDFGNFGAFGEYDATNLRCTYDESYLLSCTISADGIPTPLVFGWLPFGNGNFEWTGHTKPEGPTMNLYVELASSLVSSTASPSSPTTLLTTLTTTAVDTVSSTAYSNTTSSLAISPTVSPIALSTAPPNATAAYDVSSNASTTTTPTASPTVAATCTLIPRLPNGGFEDGTNQTAWLASDDSFSSWAPTTTNPFDGALSGQFTFRTSANLTQTPTRVILTNALSNICPGARYSISYRSYCDVSTKEDCYVRIWTSDSAKGEAHSSRTQPSSDWTLNNDAFEFIAASSTSKLHVYVGTLTDSRDVGYIYLDDFGIALSESQDIQNRVQEKILL